MGLEPKKFDAVEDTMDDYKIKYDMWNALKNWELKIATWNEVPFNTIDVEAITQEVE